MALLDWLAVALIVALVKVSAEIYEWTVGITNGMHDKSAT